MGIKCRVLKQSISRFFCVIVPVRLVGSVRIFSNARVWILAVSIQALLEALIVGLDGSWVSMAGVTQGFEPLGGASRWLHALLETGAVG